MSSDSPRGTDGSSRVRSSNSSGTGNGNGSNNNRSNSVRGRGGRNDRNRNNNNNTNNRGGRGRGRGRGRGGGHGQSRQGGRGRGSGGNKNDPNRFKAIPRKASAVANKEKQQQSNGGHQRRPQQPQQPNSRWNRSGEDADGNSRGKGRGRGSNNNGGRGRGRGRSGPIVFKKKAAGTDATAGARDPPGEVSMPSAKPSVPVPKPAESPKAPVLPKPAPTQTKEKEVDPLAGFVPSTKPDAPVLEAVSVRRSVPNGGFATAVKPKTANANDNDNDTEAEAEETPTETKAKPTVTAKAGGGGGGWWTKKAEVRSADSDFRELHKAATHFTTASQQQVAANKLSREENEARLFDQKGQGKGINFNKYDNIPVQATGRECPECFETFEELMEIEALATSRCAQQMLANIKRSGFSSPTPVQKWSLPIALAKRDLMACAQTGSGKTGGFLFPLVLRTDFLERRHRREPNPSSLILAPTRELATQIFNEAEKFTYDTGVQVVVVYGGTNFGDQAKTLRRGCDVLVATPGRLCHLLDHRKVSLRDCEHLVLDEADRMLDMGFEPQIRNVVEQHHMPMVGERLTLMFSATFPRMIQQLASDFLDDYIFLTVGRVGSTTDNIKQFVYYVEPREKLNKVCELLREPHLKGLTLVFVETKRSANQLEDELYRQGHRVTSIHGDRTQEEREEALHNFKHGYAQVLVATDVASRGLDIPEVKHVINYDMPSDIDSYVHRIGRTGRAGNTGTASAFFCDKNNNIVRPLLELLKEANQQIPEWLKYKQHQMSHPDEYGGKRGGGNFGGRDYRQGNNGGGNHRGKNRGHRGGPRGNSYAPRQPAPAASTTDAW